MICEANVTHKPGYTALNNAFGFAKLDAQYSLGFRGVLGGL